MNELILPVAASLLAAAIITSSKGARRATGSLFNRLLGRSGLVIVFGNKPFDPPGGGSYQNMIVQQLKVGMRLQLRNNTNQEVVLSEFTSRLRVPEGYPWQPLKYGTSDFDSAVTIEPFSYYPMKITFVINVGTVVELKPEGSIHKFTEQLRDAPALLEGELAYSYVSGHREREKTVPVQLPVGQYLADIQINFIEDHLHSAPPDWPDRNTVTAQLGELKRIAGEKGYRASAE